MLSTSWQNAKMGKQPWSVSNCDSSTKCILSWDQIWTCWIKLNKWWTSREWLKLNTNKISWVEFLYLKLAAELNLTKRSKNLLEQLNIEGKSNVDEHEKGFVISRFISVNFGDKLKRKLLSISWKMLSYQRVQTETNFIRVGVRTISHCMVVALAMRDVTENILLVFDYLKIFKLTNLISSFKLI